MYEEEDDDLPLHYRRLTAHLQTGSADFNRRLAAYLTNQVAMRSAMEQMAQNSFGHYPGGSFAGGAGGMFPSPMLPQQGMAHSPGAYQRPAPYPSPHQPNFRQLHGRAYSMQSMPTAQGPASPSTPAHHNSLDSRRMSTPATAGPGSSTTPHLQTDGVKADPEYLRQTQSATLPQGGPGSAPPLWQDMGPFTTSLPPESQQMLAHAPGFDVNDPSFAMLMQGSEQYVNHPYYPWQSMQGGIKGMPVHPSAYHGMSTTLAPAALENAVDSTPNHTSTTASTPATTHASAPPARIDTLPTAGLDFNFSQDSKEPGFVTMAGGMPTGSGQVTPAGEGFWDHFVMDGSWEDGANEGHPSLSGSHPGSLDLGPENEVPG